MRIIQLEHDYGFEETKEKEKIMHAFLLMVYMGQALVSKDMYFKNINDCLYFADRLNNQPMVPNRNAQEGVDKLVKYVAVCVPKNVGNNVKTY